MFKKYCRQDVEAERAIARRLAGFSVLPGEQDLWVLDQVINDRGVLADLPFASNAIALDDRIKSKLLSQAKALTGLDNPKSAAQIKAWIADTAGVEVESLEKKKIASVREAANSAEVDALLNLRASFSKTSTEKYSAMLRSACPDSRLRGLTMFYGAGRTGRWAGRLVQMQNLPQNKMDSRDLDAARQLVANGLFDAVELLFDKPADMLSQLIRTAFIPRPGRRFIVADFSAIEARMIAWLAGEKWRMDVFNTHGKIYEASAERMFKLPSGTVQKGDPRRQRGKIAELALGFGGGVGALRAMGALEMGLDESELGPLVRNWRASNKAITDFWWDVDAAVRQVIITKAPITLKHGVRIRQEGPLLRLRLPSGRELAYVKPRIIDDSICYDGLIQTTNKWGKVETYGPKLVENIVQAASRDCLGRAISTCEKHGFPVVFHVHDEVILEVPIGVSSAKEVAELLGQGIEWAPGLPLKADAYECDYYMKD